VVRPRDARLRTALPLGPKAATAREIEAIGVNYRNKNMQRSLRSSVMIEVGAGELVDKITILSIKRERISDAAKLRNVAHELEVLERALKADLPVSAELDRMQAALREVNEALWQVEDDIRMCEAAADFGPGFIALARSVYRLNDRRAAIKRAINDHCGSSIVEEKSYAEGS
jgi:post-segregation antitoxin (ccd killing protein)